MTYAIVVNMDYENNPPETCGDLWEEIKRRMLAAGFIRDGRTFTTSLPEKEATRLARRVMAELEEQLERHDRDVYHYLRDFYGYDLAYTTNLMLPPTEEIEVEEETPTRPSKPGQ
ncbi:MAG TPA: hypothetical protein VKA50_08285 [Gammaproteobacteria bacterium]|nr:hypothetical protein [Gammaproteobacteria bacterium]